MQRQGDASHVTSDRSIEPVSDSVLLMNRTQEMSVRESRTIWCRSYRLMAIWYLTIQISLKVLRLFSEAAEKFSFLFSWQVCYELERAGEVAVGVFLTVLCRHYPLASDKPKTPARIAEHSIIYLCIHSLCMNLLTGWLARILSQFNPVQMFSTYFSNLRFTTFSAVDLPLAAFHRFHHHNFECTSSFLIYPIYPIGSWVQSRSTC